MLKDKRIHDKSVKFFIISHVLSYFVSVSSTLLIIKEIRKGGDY